MTGQELAKLAESKVFRPAVMDTTINEFVPSKNAFLLTDAFLPLKLVEKDLVIDMINHGAFGRTTPINLGADHKRISIPGQDYKEHRGGHWREAVEYGEDVLAKAVNPQRPTELWGAGLVSAALKFMATRLDNQIEFVTSKIVITGKYSEARYGVNYTYDPLIPAKYFRDVTGTPGWTTGGTWATRATSTPIQDIVEAVNLMRIYGLNPVEVLMSQKTSNDFFLSADTQNKIKASPQLIGRGVNVSAIFEVLSNLTMRLDNRLYAEESRLTADSPAADTVIDVVDASEFVAGDKGTLRNSIGEEEEVTISSISGNAVTISAGTAKAYKIGDRLTIYKRFLPENYIVIRGESDDVNPNNWISTPSLVKGKSWDNPQPGRYTWRTFKDTVPYRLEIGAGIDGGPKVSRCTWMAVKTA